MKWKNTFTWRTHACGVYLLSDLVHVLRQELVHPPHVSSQELLRAWLLLPVVTEKTEISDLITNNFYFEKFEKSYKKNKLIFWFPSFGLSCFMTRKQGSVLTGWCNSHVGQQRALNRGQIHGNQIQPIRAELCGLLLYVIMKHTPEKLWMVRRSGLPRACPAAPWHYAAPTSCTEPRCWTQPCCLGPETASRSDRWTSWTWQEDSRSKTKSLGLIVEPRDHHHLWVCSEDIDSELEHTCPSSNSGSTAHRGPPCHRQHVPSSGNNDNT